MNIETLKNTPPFSVTSRTPGSEKVPLNQVAQLLTDSILENIVLFENAIEANERLDRLDRESTLFANERQLSKISSPAALKAWAAERLPGLGISYGFSNRLTREVSEQTLDQQASLQIMQFADDLILVANFCRTISELTIEVLAHSHGIEFRFVVKGNLFQPHLETSEQESFNQLLKAKSRNNSFKNKIIATDDRVEAQSILFRKKVRLGISSL